MKELILENPPRRKKSRRSAAQHAATRKLVALAKRRRSSRKTRKSRPSFPSMSKSTRRKASRRSRSSFLVKGRSLVKLNPFTGSVFTKENLGIAGGAVAGTVVSNYALGALAGRFGSMNPYGRAAFNVLIPVVGAMVVKRFAPNVAKGMIIGGLANGLGQLVTASGLLPAGTTAPVQTVAPKASAPALPATTGEYLGEYLGEYVGGVPTDSGMANSSAFSPAW